MWTFPPLLLLLLAVVGTANAFVAFPINAATSALRYHFADRDDAFTSSTGGGAKDTVAINGASGFMKMKKSVTAGGMASPRVSKTKANLFFADGADDEDDEKTTTTTSVATAAKEGTSSMAETVVIDPDFRVAAFFLAIGLVLDQIPFIQLTLGPLVTALGILFLVQTFRLRFVFDDEAGTFELKTVSDFGLGSILGGGDDNNDSGSLQEAGENVVVGGTNRWATSSIFNYDFYPQGWMEDENNPVGPILVYFKEDQTPSETWNEGPGKIANDPAKIEAGIARAGQVHFFPTVANAQQLRDEFAKRGCKKI